ncbi:MAG TPA: hypothetical protein VM307_14580 [Egibacteraceae bacterium]|nr:hypothetical protein [Egibacteraceae bacterium]
MTATMTHDDAPTDFRPRQGKLARIDHPNVTEEMVLGSEQLRSAPFPIPLHMRLTHPVTPADWCVTAKLSRDRTIEVIALTRCACPEPDRLARAQKFTDEMRAQSPLYQRLTAADVMEAADNAYRAFYHDQEPHVVERTVRSTLARAGVGAVVTLLLRPSESFEGRWHVKAANDLATGDIVSIDSGHGWFGAGLVERRDGDKLVVAIRSLDELPAERDEVRLAEFAAWRAEQGRRWDQQYGGTGAH